MPLNVRTLNLNNFPPNLVPNSKRQYSIAMQKARASSSLNGETKEKCLSILKANLQAFLNERVNEALDSFRLDFVEPIMNNLKQNKTSDVIRQDDVAYLMIGLLDDARKSFKDRHLPQFATASESCSTSTLKRKSSDDDESTEKENETAKQAKKAVEESDDAEKRTPTSAGSSVGSSVFDVIFKPVSIEASTRFVLGKHVNELYLQLHQDGTGSSSPNNILNSGTSSSNTASINGTTKSIYTKYPTLFKYEADQADRQWLTEKSILKRKNLKCYILIYDEVLDLFRFKFFAAADNNGNSKSSEHVDADSSRIKMDSMMRKLRAFHLSEKIIDKLRRQYATVRF